MIQVTQVPSRTSRRFHRIAVVAAAIGVGASLGPAAQDRPDLTGTWKLNVEQTTQAGRRSADDRAVIAGRRIPIGGSPVGMGGGGGQGPAAVADMGATSRQRPEELAKTREAIRIAMLIPDQLTIVREAAALVVTDGLGGPHKLPLDRKTVPSQIGALTIETKTKWDGAVLVVERKIEGDVKSTDRYSLTGSPKRLTIVSKVESKKLADDRSRTVHRVYDAQ
jgi:hypothetical protein